MSEQSIPEITAEELRAISRKLSTYVELHPDERDARSLAIRCGEIAALHEAPSAYHRLRVTDRGSEGLEDRVLRIASGAPRLDAKYDLPASSRWCGSRWMDFGLSALLTIGSGFESGACLTSKMDQRTPAAESARRCDEPATPRLWQHMRREGDAPALVVRDNKTLHDSTRGRTRVELFQAIKRYPGGMSIRGPSTLKIRNLNLIWMNTIKPRTLGRQ